MDSISNEFVINFTNFLGHNLCRSCRDASRLLRQATSRFEERDMGFLRLSGADEN